MILSPQSVNYLRPDIEYNQLTKENINNCTPGANVTLPSNLDLQVRTRTTGHGIIFLEGQYDFGGAIAADEVVVSLPAFQDALQIYYVTGTLINVAVFTPTTFRVTGNTIESTAAIAAGTSLHFDGCYYLAISN